MSPSVVNWATRTRKSSPASAACASAAIQPPPTGVLKTKLVPDSKALHASSVPWVETDAPSQVR